MKSSARRILRRRRPNIKSIFGGREAPKIRNDGGEDDDDDGTTGPTAASGRLAIKTARRRGDDMRNVVIPLAQLCGRLPDIRRSRRVAVRQKRRRRLQTRSGLFNLLSASCRRFPAPTLP